MNSKQNTNRQKQNKVSKSIFTARSERSDVEIQKHFIPSAKSRDEINTGVDSFPIIGDIENNVEVSVNIDKPNKVTKKSFFVNDPTEISLDVVFPNEIDTNVEFFNSNNNDIQIDTCTSLNKKVEDINKQLADLEKDIQFNFYDPRTKVGSNLKKYSSHLQSFSSSKNVSNTSSTTLEYGNFNKFNNAPKQSDPSIELKNEIYNYRSSLKQKDFEEKIEKRLEMLHKQKEQSELRKNNETKVESGHEPTCPLSLKIDLPESVLKIHEMQLTAKRVKIAEGAGGAPNNTQNATSSQTSPQKDDQTTIQNMEQEPSTSKSKSNDIITPKDNENNLQESTSSVNVGVVQQLDSLLKKSTGELDELKGLLKEYLETEKANKSPRIDKNVKFQIKDNTSTRRREKENDAKTKKKIKPPTSRSSSNSDISLTSSNVKSRKKVPREPQCRQIMDVQEKSKVIKIKQISKSTKTTKCELSDISESNEMERNSSNSSSDIIKSKPVISSKKQSKKGPGTSKCTDICKSRLTNDKQKEFILNIVSKSNVSSSLSSSSSSSSVDDEDKRTHIRDFIEKTPKDPNDLTNPPNTVRSIRLALPEKNEEIKKKEIDKKNHLRVQILPALDIKRSLTTQKLPDVAIESIDDFNDTNKMSSENVKYIQIMHHSDKDLPKEEPSGSDNKSISPRTKATSPSKSVTTDIKIKEIFIAQHQISSSTDASVHDDIQPKEIPKERGTISEELNLDIESLPSVRTLKEIQIYLEQKCALIRSRLQEESTLKTGETLSLRYKLSEPPLWQSSKAEPQNETITIIPEQQSTNQPITLSPLKTYSSVETPLSPLQKQHKSQQVKHNPSLSYNTNTLKNNVDKSLQVSIMEYIGLPIAREDNVHSSAQFSIQTSNKDIHEIKEDFNTPPLTLAKSTSICDSIPEKNVSTQTTGFLKIICLPRDNQEKNNTQLVSHENQVTNKPLTDIKTFSNISTQINEYNYATQQPAKHVSFKTVTEQFSFIPNENKETQISPLDFNEEMTKTPKVIKKHENTQMTTINNETMIKEKAAPIIRYVQSNATQTVDVKDKFTICNIKETKNENEKEKEMVQIMAPPNCKETKECCTQYSPVHQELLDTTEYKHINSFRKIENEEPSKHVHYPEEKRRCYYKSKMKNKRTAPERHKICSTPVSASSSSISTAETVSFSDGEVKLSCECSTSIGEIHLCRFANDIRKRVRILKQNPEQVLKDSFGGSNFKMKRQHKYNENWFAYYVTKTESSSEQRTGSNLSSIKSNTETE